MTQDRDPDGDPAEVPVEGASGSKRRLSTRARALVIGFVLVLALAGIDWGYRYETYGRFQQSTDDAAIAADIVTVAPRIAGYVEAVAVIDNQDVRAGQPLVRIDARDADAQAREAEARIGLAETQMSGARAQIREQLATIDQARAQLAAARIKADYDAGEVARYRPLAASGAETGQQLAQLEAAARQSVHSVQAQMAALTTQERRVASIQAQVGEGAAHGRAAKASLAAANVDVEASIVRAAEGGRVGDKTITVGQYVQAGTPLMSIVPLDALYVTANFKETQVAMMRRGQPVSIRVDALAGVPLEGRIESLSPGTGAQFSLLPPQNATGNFTKVTQRVPVRISILAPPAVRKLLAAGLSVSVSVDTRSGRGELEAIRDQQKTADQSGRH